MSRGSVALLVMALAWASPGAAEQLRGDWDGKVDGQVAVDYEVAEDGNTYVRELWEGGVVVTKVIDPGGDEVTRTRGPGGWRARGTYDSETDRRVSKGRNARTGVFGLWQEQGGETRVKVARPAVRAVRPVRPRAAARRPRGVRVRIPARVAVGRPAHRRIMSGLCVTEDSPGGAEEEGAWGDEEED